MKRTIFPFSAVYDDEISLKFNDIVTVKEENINVEGWCEISFNGNTGKVPTKILEDLHFYEIGMEGKVTRDFLAPTDSGQYLTVNKNEIIQIVSRYSNGWDLGYSQKHIGLIPSEIIEISKENRIEQLAMVKTKNKNFTSDNT